MRVALRIANPSSSIETCSRVVKTLLLQRDFCGPPALTHILTLVSGPRVTNAIAVEAHSNESDRLAPDRTVEVYGIQLGAAAATH